MLKAFPHLFCLHLYERQFSLIEEKEIRAHGFCKNCKIQAVNLPSFSANERFKTLTMHFPLIRISFSSSMAFF